LPEEEQLTACYYAFKWKKKEEVFNLPLRGKRNASSEKGGEKEES